MGRRLYAVGLALFFAWFLDYFRIPDDIFYLFLLLPGLHSLQANPLIWENRRSWLTPFFYARLRRQAEENPLDGLALGTYLLQNRPIHWEFAEELIRKCAARAGIEGDPLSLIRPLGSG